MLMNSRIRLTACCNTPLCFKHGHCLKEALNYLGMYFEGPLSDMYDVWDACRKPEVDALTIERKILAVIEYGRIYTKMPDVFNHYYKYGKKRGHNKSVCFLLLLQVFN